MKTLSVRIREYKGVAAELGWAPVMVLFGPNDSGKTNLLESLAASLGGTPPEKDIRRADPTLGAPDHVDAEVRVTFDGLNVPGHADRRLLAQLLGPGAPGNGTRTAGDVFVGANEDLMDGIGPFLLPSPSEPTEAFDELIGALRGQCLKAADERCTDFTEVSQSYSALLELCLGSPHFLVCFGLHWLTPRPCERAPEAHSHARFLDEHRGLWATGRIPILESFVQTLLAGNPEQVEWCSAVPVDYSRLWQLVPLTQISQDSRALTRRIEDWLVACRERALGAVIKMPAATIPIPQRLLAQAGRDGAVRVHPQVNELCEHLSHETTTIAPRFISGHYRIVIEPLAPDLWHAFDGAQVRLCLEQLTGRQRFDLSIVGSGLASWSCYAVAEALRTITSPDQDPTAPRPAAVIEPPDPGSQWLTDAEQWGEIAEFEPSRCPHPNTRARPSDAHVPQTVFLLDEPERSLHPRAQEEAAAWVAARAQRGANFVVATHSLPFLELPLQEVEYVSVARTDTWTTEVQPITDDIAGAVRDSADKLGLSPVVCIQLTRAWLIVEGEHDCKVIHAFYGDELRRSRVQILALRGANSAKASFLNLGALALLGRPFFVVLDNIRADWIKTGSVPGEETQEERIATQLLHLRDTPGLDLEVRGLPYPDIICALPFDAVQTVASQRCGRPAAASSWQQLIAQHEERTRNPAGKPRPPGFKRFALDSLGLKNVDADTFVAEVLEASDGRPPDGDPLGRIIEEIAARADPSPPTGI